MSNRANANRLYRAADPKERMTLHLDAELASRIEQARGQQSRNAWIVQACVAALDEQEQEQA